MKSFDVFAETRRRWSRKNAVGLSPRARQHRCRWSLVARCCGEASTPVAAVGWLAGKRTSTKRPALRSCRHAGGSSAPAAPPESHSGTLLRLSRSRACGRRAGCGWPRQDKDGAAVDQCLGWAPHGSQHPPDSRRFFYSPDRKGEHPQKHIKTFTGVLHADGNVGFNAVFETAR